MALRVAAAIWFLLTLIMLGTALDGLGDGNASNVVFGIAFGGVCGWLGYRLLRRPTRDVALIAACAAGFLVILVVGTIAGGSLDPLPGGLVAVALPGLAGLLPLRWREQ